MKFYIFQLPISNNRIIANYNKDEFCVDDYVPTWVGDCEGNDESTCEKLFYIFNNEHPEHFAGHSMSTSDVILFYNPETKERKAFYCQAFGWVEIEFEH